ncbi:MAG: mannose-6-phosphate isomerase [Candidatus Parcubacteria bacterium]|jgi:mannose-6-phosphate isomerase-like protein (cupin superfamily)|nr:mannose-6-phosphate isomerase [Candidatus Parcubacteria bacterium]
MQSPKPYREQRPWGEELWITNEKPSMVKVLVVKPGEALSLQYHHHRDEYWHVLSGDGSAVIGEKEFPLAAGDDHFIPRETRHRLLGGTKAGARPLNILELSFGDVDEKDIVRLEDKYGRIGGIQGAEGAVPTKT